ncbi:MAG: HlyD family secretion protein, partial [Deltaproteobacteria bacterium]|nr:HlyD family secretion protein [Deltaproteobacteria bacterium]
MTDETGERPAKKIPANGKKYKAIAILLIIVAGASWAGLQLFIKSKTHIETDNAFVEARIVPVSARVSGSVARVLVKDNQLVRQGDLLLEIDQRDQRLLVSKAAAGVGMAVNESGGELLKAEAAKAAVQSAGARYDQAVLDHARGEKLFLREVISREQLDRLITAKRVTESQLKEAEEALKRAQAEAGAGDKGANRAKILQRKAQL